MPAVDVLDPGFCFKGREQFIFDIGVRAGQGVKKRRFSRVGVAHNGHGSEISFPAPGPQKVPVFGHFLQLIFDAFDAPPDFAAVPLKFRFSPAAGSDTATQTGKHNAFVGFSVNEYFRQIKEFLKGTDYEDSPIIPISAQHNINVDAVIEAIETYIPTPKRNRDADLRMFVSRSFDINKPGQDISTLKGGVLGGAVQQGMIKTGDTIEIRPGQIYEEANRKVWKPIKTNVKKIMTGSKEIKEAGPGGSIALLTDLDPSVVKSDSFTGNIVGFEGKLPEVWDNLMLEVHLLERVVGTSEDAKVEPLKMGEVLMLNVNSAATVGAVVKLGKNRIDCRLKLPVCADRGSRVTISRRVGTRFRLIGYGILSE